jgi:hypothetical protein
LLIVDAKSKVPYGIAEHQGRILSGYGLANTPPHVQDWIRHELSRIADKSTRVGVLVTDGNLLWAIRDYPPGFWAVWSPSWNPDRLVEGLASGSADVIIGIENVKSDAKPRYYLDQSSRLRWDIPDEALVVLREQYRPVAKAFEYIIYQKRSHTTTPDL